MKYIAIITVALLSATTALQAQETPEMPKPTQEHKWLEKFVGEWENEGECFMEPDKPPMKSKGSESARMLGDFWVVSEGTGEAMGAPFSNILTLGYDPAKKKYVGTWVDSMTGILWVYEGTVNEVGTKLTLNTEGPCPMTGKHLKFKEEIEFTDDDHKIFTSSIMGDDGKWTKAMQMTAARKK